MKKPLSFYQPTMQIPDTTSGFDISNSLLIPGFRKPGDAFGDKPLMQNLYDTQKFSQSVEPLKAQKAEEDIRRNQFRGNMLMALGDALRGKDISSGFLQRQQLFQQQAEKRIAEAEVAQKKQRYNDIYNSAPPNIQRMMDAYSAGVPEYVIESQFEKPASPGTMYEIVDGNNNFVGNISSRDFQANGYKKYEDMGVDTSNFKLKGLASGTQAADSNRMSTFSEENKPIADKWQAVSTLHGSLQRYGNELVKMDEAALSGVGGTSKFVTSIIENTKGFLQFASKDTNSFYNQAIADNSFVTADGTDYTEKVKSIANQYSINESEVRDLAFLFAAARGQEGRGLSDKDYENALTIVSGGVGKEGKIAVIESVYNRLGGEVSKIVNDRIKRLEYQKTFYGPEKQDYFNIELGQLRSLQEATPFNPFSNPLLRQTTPAPTLTIEEILNDLDIKY